MVVFNDSTALRQAYAALHEEYKPTEQDQYYEHCLRQIQSDPKKKETIIAMSRVRVAEGEEYIVYIHQWEGQNPIGSYVNITQTDVGLYPNFQPIKERYITEEGTYADRVISKNVSVGYYIPFTKETANDLHKLCNDITAKAGAKTKYYIENEGSNKIVINSYNDWVNGDFDDLHENGTITKSLTNDDSNKRETQRQH
jgi:hypothetical protein